LQTVLQLLRILTEKVQNFGLKVTRTGSVSNYNYGMMCPTQLDTS